MNLRPLRDDPTVGAILWTWFPGGEGGAAVADVLSGAVNPSGRLASTFAEKVSDYASDAGFAESRAYVPYEDDIFVGYRYFETIPGAKDKVVYPFGHGLSYTTATRRRRAARPSIRADGSRTAAPVVYPGAKGMAPGKKPRAKPLKKASVTLFDVADGKATMDQLLDQMTLDEMLHLLYGHPKHDPSGTGSIGDLAKFGVSAAQTCDGPAGVRRATPSSYFPCASLLAGTFDAKLIEEVGAAICTLIVLLYADSSCKSAHKMLKYMQINLKREDSDACL